MRVFLDPRLHFGRDVVVRGPYQPLGCGWLHVVDPCLTATGMSLDMVTDIVRTQVARREDDGLGVQLIVALSALMQ